MVSSVFNEDNSESIEITIESCKARATIWYKHTPSLQGEVVGIIGSFEADNFECANQLLNTCCEKLKGYGCTVAVGPMNQTTWNSYRWVVTESDLEPFFLEPQNKKDYPLYFEKAGFIPKWQYISSKERDLTRIDPKLTAVKEKMDTLGVTIRPINVENYDEELNKIYKVSLESFKQNVLYSPIEWDAFKNMYNPIVPYIKSELVWLAEYEKEPVGFAFAIPDYNQAKRGETMNTVIFKTIAILPRPELSGLGTVLAEQVRSQAKHMGFTQVIYALIYEDNRSKQIPNKYDAEIIRRYHLYEKEL